MKSKEEIEQLAANLANPNACKTTNWIEGYTQCQEDMADTSKVTRFEVIPNSPELRPIDFVILVTFSSSILLVLLIILNILDI